MNAEVAIVGAGAVGAATALALARRDASVVVLEAEHEPALWASGANSGVLHTGFDSVPGELETELMLRSALRRERVLGALRLPVLRCGARLHPRAAGPDVVGLLAANAQRNGVQVLLRADGALKVPGEAVTDPVAYTVGLAQAAGRHGAELRTGFEVAAVQRDDAGFTLEGIGGDAVRCRLVVNCAGLHVDAVARLAGDDSFELRPSKGEYLVFDPPAGERLDRILLAAPTERTRGVMVVPTVDGKVIAGPTTVDQEDRYDRSVTPGARREIQPHATVLWPALEGAEPIAAYAGLRAECRGRGHLIEPSRACAGLVNVAAFESTGLSASLAIADHVCGIVQRLGVVLRGERPLEPGPAPRSRAPWWRRAAERSSA